MHVGLTSITKKKVTVIVTEIITMMIMQYVLLKGLYALKNSNKKLNQSFLVEPIFSAYLVFETPQY